MGDLGRKEDDNDGDGDGNGNGNFLDGNGVLLLSTWCCGIVIWKLAGVCFSGGHLVSS